MCGFEVPAEIAARLVELGYAAVDGELADDVVAVERWIATLVPELDAGLEALSDVKLMMERNTRAENAERAFLSLRSKARLEPALARHLSVY